MLCVVAQYESDNSEKKLAFVERVHSVAKLSNSFSEHGDGVNDISTEQLHTLDNNLYSNCCNVYVDKAVEEINM